MKGINCTNLIRIGPIVVEIRGVENGDLVVPVNNTLVCHTSSLAADTLLCVLMTTTDGFMISCLLKLYLMNLQYGDMCGHVMDCS